MKVPISNIQRFSLQDGPGIRTTVFFMGCSLKCPWCCNPENMTADFKEYEDEKGQIKHYGKSYTSYEIESEVLKDREFYEEDGGVTYSGGEALLYLSKLQPLLKSLNEKKIHQCVETSLNVPKENLLGVIDYINLFYIDLKIVDENLFFDKLNGKLKLVEDNLDILLKNKSKFVFRIPLVYGYTLSEENLKKIKKFINKYKPLDVEVFSVHNLGKSKYKNLKIKYEDFEPVSDEIVDKVKKFLLKN